ncbi:MAG: lytic transglycosylase domain-containing protein [Kiritimatiellaeota bacterium]|nr:lytic transglycosylase domain-containing protein [Kiritimatiellota bacterium]
MTRQILHLAVKTLAIGLLMAGVAGVAFYFYIHAYDDMIAKASSEYGVDSKLIRAVIWRESHFNRRHIGKNKEIGLMQVTQNAARDWATAAHEPIPFHQDLFKPEINIRTGTWYLHRAIQYWSAKPKANPLPYALAEYNAGRSNTLRWAAHDQNDPNVFWNEITYPSTRRYIRDIMCNYRRNR